MGCFTYLHAQSAFSYDSLLGFDEKKALSQLREKNLNPAQIKHYLDWRKKEYIDRQKGTWQQPINPYQSYKYTNTTQSVDCNNVDFEAGNLIGWSGKYGDHPNYFTSNICVPATNPICPNNGLLAGRHTIVSGAGFDPIIGSPLKMVATGGNYSLRLGNDDYNGECDQIEQTFTVVNTHFTYRYAVILQNPVGHQLSEQPFFRVDVYSSNGQIIPCAKYEVQATNGLSGFQAKNVNGEQVLWRDWTTVTIDLSSMLGQDITVRFTVADCAQGGHFGYAYLDCSCNSLLVTQRDTVCPGESCTLEAPSGFLQYEWSPAGETTQSITAMNLGTYTVSMTSFQNCVSFALYDLYKFPDPVADFVAEVPETELLVAFHDGSYIYEGSVVSWLWDFGDGSISTEQSPVHLYADGGQYNVKLTVESDRGCSATVAKDVFVGGVTFFAPSAFTPNNDGQNDFFLPQKFGVKKYQIFIFDRWGNMVFTSSNQNEPWFGDVKGKKGIANQDVYIWKVQLVDVFDKEAEYIGHVALIR